MAAKPELFLQSEALTGEGPIIDGHTLHWIDIPAGQVHRTNRETLHTESIDLGIVVGAVAPIESAEGYAVACKKGFGIWRNNSLDLRDPFLHSPDYRMNDAKCDARGRFWGGSCHMEFIPGQGKLHRWDGGVNNQVMVEKLALPNGLGWNRENNLMYLADSITKKVFVSAFDLADDFIPEFRELITIDSGLPDGLAIDNDGCIWLAVWGGSRVIQISPQGKIVSEHLFPVSQPSSCAFGEDGTLYVTSARGGISEVDLQEQPLAGSLFNLATETTGVPISKFKESR